mgnify:CR=1 FL=1
MEIFDKQYRGVGTYLDEDKLADDGDCYVKCLQEVYRWFGINMISSKIVCVVDSASLRYENKDLCQVVCFENWFRLNGVAANEEKHRFSDLNHGIETLKTALRAGKIIILSANTFYLDYTDDYKKNSGGFFRTGHSLIVHGFDDNKQEFLFSDPTFKRMNKSITYENLGLAWTYHEPIDTFVPLCASFFSKSKTYNSVDIMFDALERFICYFFEEDSSSTVYPQWKRVRCMNHLINTIDSILEKNNIIEDNSIIDNIAYSIHHYIRWSRKSFGEFLKSGEFLSLNLSDSSIEFWEKAFDSWTAIGMGMYKVVHTSNYEKLVEVRGKIVKLVLDEIMHINELRNTLVGITA